MNIVRSDDFVSEEIIKNSLQENLSSYNLDFNLLPPTDRIIIPTINLNAPLLQSSFTKNIDSITKDDFNKDLTKWVVQYPTTPKAWAGGNTLIFGHTSVESRKGNPYSTIFSKLPKLLSWDTLQIVQNGKLYEYAVIAKVIVAPDKVNAEYLKYTNGNYLTLLGCYPLWSDKQRILIIGKMKDIKN
jgi:LPXTG-site transpeptidase (sortase) family protein